MEAAASEDALAAEVTGKMLAVRSFTRRRPSRRPFLANIERERVMLPSPINCPCGGSSNLSKLGKDVTETLEEIARRWKVIETVREKYSCRAGQAISHAIAPFLATPRGYIRPPLLARIVFDKYTLHQPLNRQSERFRVEGIDLGLLTLADQVGVAVFVALPLYRLVEGYVLATERLHGDDKPPDPGQGQDGGR